MSQVLQHKFQLDESEMPTRWYNVLHDLPNGAMDHLAEFIEVARAAGARFRQDFPPDCVPLLRGEAVAPLEAYVG